MNKKVTVENQSTSVANFTKASETEYTINYGTLKRGANSVVQLKFENDLNLLSFTTKVSCGSCTAAKIMTKLNTEATVNVSYKTSILGIIDRKVFVIYREEGKTKDTQIVIHLKGKVIN